MTEDNEDSARRSFKADESPYRPPASEQPVPGVSGEPSRDPSVFAEPWMQSTRNRPVIPLEANLTPADTEADAAEMSVWDEPATSSSLAGEVPEGAVTWMGWYESQVAKSSVSTTWNVTWGIATISGLLAVVGAVVATPQEWLAVVVAGPLTEEILKIALPIWVVEKRPWLFSSRFQILFCGACAGLVFSVLENLLYLNVYISNPSSEIIAWRWTVCVILHVGCSLVAALGVARVWQVFQNERRRPQLLDGARLITTAIVIHGIYNLMAVLFELSNGGF